jgi:Na+/H+ antiporter NhaC
VIPFNAWPFYVAGLVAGTIPLLPDAEAGYAFFWSSIPFNFYAIFAVFGTLLFSLHLLPWVGGRMAGARERARTTGELDAEGAEPFLPPEAFGREPVRGYQPSLLDFLVPIGVLLSVAILPDILFDTKTVNEAFLLCVLSAMVVAGLRGLPLREVIDGFVGGCRNMTIGAIVLGLAVTLGTVSKELGTAAYVVETMGDAIPAAALPGILTLLCMSIAFSTGTSWGTYAVVFPVAMPLAFALNPDPTFLRICFGAVLGGAVFGDQCSPISDTTILSSMFTGCDMMDHVRTQIPLALAAAGVGILASTVFALGL